MSTDRPTLTTSNFKWMLSYGAKNTTGKKRIWENNYNKSSLKGIAVEFSRHNPPKKVDIFMMAVLEFHERPGSPLYHVEHFIDGEYVKYNSNSGFVDNRMCRQTPHTFSHFTFERSGHELIVVDVQGVGDLYTDPQIHTSDGTTKKRLLIILGSFMASLNVKSSLAPFLFCIFFHPKTLILFFARPCRQLRHTSWQRLVLTQEH